MSYDIAGSRLLLARSLTYAPLEEFNRSINGRENYGKNSPDPCNRIYLPPVGQKSLLQTTRDGLQDAEVLGLQLTEHLIVLYVYRLYNANITGAQRGETRTIHSPV